MPLCGWLKTIYEESGQYVDSQIFLNQSFCNDSLMYYLTVCYPVMYHYLLFSPCIAVIQELLVTHY